MKFYSTPAPSSLRGECYTNRAHSVEGPKQSICNSVLKMDCFGQRSPRLLIGQCMPRNDVVERLAHV